MKFSTFTTIWLLVFTFIQPWHAFSQNTYMPCSTVSPITLEDSFDENTAERMGASCRSYLYGTYGGSCTYTNCTVPPTTFPSCPKYRVPVAFTVFRTNSGTLSYDTSKIYTKLIELNLIYAQANLQLVMSQSIRFINDTDLYSFVTGNSTDPDDGINDDTELETLDLPNVLNVYVANTLINSGANSCGYAYFPSTYTSGGSVNTKNRAVLASACVNPSDESLEHEIGHLFGLYHTHNGASGNVPNEPANGSGACTFGAPNSSLAANDPNNPSNKGDGISDTPPDPLLIGMVNNSCQYVGPYTPDPSQGIDTRNIMGYTNYNGCNPVHFSACQLRKINDCLLECRDYLCAANVAIDFNATIINHPESPFWEICVGDAIPTLHTYNNCYNWYDGASANATLLASSTGSFTPSSIVNNNLPGIYEVWVEEANNYAIDRPCRRKATITVLPDAGNGISPANNNLCCNESIILTTQNANTPAPYTTAFWVDTAPVTNGTGLAAAQAAGKIFAADPNLSVPANQTGFIFSPNCSATFAPGNYFVTPFTSYQNLAAPQFKIGPNANINIPDYPNTAGISIPITVSQLPNNARLSQLCTFIQHEFTNDLNISLTAPNGTVIGIVNTFSLNGFGVNIGTAASPACFVTSGGYNAGGCNGNAYPNPPCYTGNINSDSPLNVDIGNPNGTWLLTITDNNNPGNNGALQFAELIFDQAPFAITFPTLPNANTSACTFGTAIPITILPENCNTSPAIVNVRLKTYLEGCYQTNTQTMTRNVALPLQQPFNTLPWNYSGGESVTNIPANAIDWVLVEARNANNPTLILDQAAAWLLNNGEIVDYEDISKGVRFDALTAGNNYRFIVRPRNHLAVMSQATQVTDQIHSNIDYNFTTAQTQAVGNQQTKAIANNIFVLFAGDIYADGVLTAFTDYNTFVNTTGNGYRLADLNLDGTVNITDFNLLRSNVGKIGLNVLRY